MLTRKIIWVYRRPLERFGLKSVAYGTQHSRNNAYYDGITFENFVTSRFFTKVFKRPNEEKLWIQTTCPPTVEHPLFYYGDKKYYNAFVKYLLVAAGCCTIANLGLILHNNVMMEREEPILHTD